MVFYRRDDGRYVMHRIYRAEKDGTYTIIGDAQTYPERGIRAEQIVCEGNSDLSESFGFMEQRYFP